jgi:glycine/D-amino acid oxidase-like deaminating enzyme/nitrite reductase/ring-hydroxylating ferredoxin subunit
MKRDGACTSLWQDSSTEKLTNGSTEKKELYDVVIAGGGFTGIVTGLLLQQAGKSVCIAEAYTAGFGTSGGTTAHLNSFLDTSYSQIIRDFGKPEASLVAQAVQNALYLIKNNVELYKIDCGYKELSGYLYATDDKQSDELNTIQEGALEVNLNSSYTESLPISVNFKSAIVFPDQAQFHPLRYLLSLKEQFENAGGQFREYCRITNVKEDEILTIETSAGNLKARNLIYATHIPPGVNLLHFRCAPYRSYVIAVRLLHDAEYPDALVYDMEEPYHYIRSQEIDGEKYLIVGGEDHKTGHESDTEACFSRLEEFTRKLFPSFTTIYKWSSQYFEPADGLPYIGQLPGNRENIFVATGYGGNGIIYSHVAAITLRSMLLNGNSTYMELFDPNRIKMVAGFSNFVKEAADVVSKLASSLVPPGAIKDLEELPAGVGKLLKYKGDKMAAYKDQQGNIYAVHPACTHIKCEVAWNSSEKSWDCPCHGSRFSITGEVLTGPARKDLGKYDLNGS